ncbi:MAG: hypothetical protein M0R49_02730 [Limnochordia bacterium]|jgi:butyrate kinase|nr:hypothetical protein [Limnochordia bacterium]
MAILAVYPHAKTLQVAVWDGTLYETSAFPLPTSGDTLTDEHLLPWLASLEIAKEDLKCIISGHRNLEFASWLGHELDTPVQVIDASTQEDCSPLALVLGTPLLERKCAADAFIFRFLVCQEAKRWRLDVNEEQFIVAHLDEEHQFAALRGTAVLDSLTSFDEGPFGLRQSGGLPFDAVLDLCMAASSQEEVLDILHDKGGLYGYLGLDNLEDLWTCRAEQASLIREALVYQIGKEVGALATVLQGQVHSIILSGDLTKYKPFIEALTERVGFIAPISVYPGSQALAALRAGA